MTPVRLSRRALIGALAFLPSGLARASAGALDGAALGLVPGEDSDQSAVLTQALAKAAAEMRPLFVPPGTYKVSRVALPEGARLAGVPGASVLRLAGEGPLFYGEKLERAALRDLVLDGGDQDMGDSGTLIGGWGVRRFEMEGLDLRASGGHGIVLERCGGHLRSATIDGVRFAALFARDSTGLSVTGNTIRNAANNGILIWRSERGDDGSIVQGNRIEDVRADAGGTGENGNAINVFRAGGVIVSGNVARRCAYSAIRVNGAENAQVTGNSIREMGEVAIYVEFGFSGAAVADNLIDRAGAGISVTNFNEGGRLATVSGNVVRDLFRRPHPETGEESYGVGIAAEADAAVSGNVVEQAAFAGLMLGWGPYLRDVSATGNVIRQSPIGIGVSVVPGAGEAVVSGNLIEGASRGAVVGMSFEEIATGDLAAPDAGPHPAITVSGNRVAG